MIGPAAKQEEGSCSSNADDPFLKPSSTNTADLYTDSGNINFFKDLESGIQTDNSATNKEHEQEKKEEKEQYEKKIGLLTYLGQDSLEANKGKEWYVDSEKCVSSLWTSERHSKCDVPETKDEEVGLKYKTSVDPLNDIIKYTGWKPFKPLSSKTSIASISQNNVVDSSLRQVSLKNSCQSLREESERKRKNKRGEKRKRSLDYSCSDGSDEDRKKKRRNRKKRRRKSTSDSYSSDSDNECRYNRGKSKKRIKNSRSKRHGKSSSRKKKRPKSSSHRRESTSSQSSSSSGSDSYTTDSEAERLEKLQKNMKLEQMRAERLAREKKERKRAELLLAGKDPNADTSKPVISNVKQKYNSQFNPIIARQNRENYTLQPGRKYF